MIYRAQRGDNMIALTFGESTNHRIEKSSGSKPLLSYLINEHTGNIKAFKSNIICAAVSVQRN